VHLLLAEPPTALIFCEEHRYAGSLAVEICCHTSLRVEECALAHQVYREACIRVSQSPLAEVIGCHIRCNVWDIDRCPFAKAEEMIGFEIAQRRCHFALAKENISASDIEPLGEERSTDIVVSDLRLRNRYPQYPLLRS